MTTCNIIVLLYNITSCAFYAMGQMLALVVQVITVVNN